MKKSMKSLLCIGLALIGMATVPPGASAFQLGLDFSAAPPNYGTNANSWNLGFAFRANTDLNVVGLGTFDNGSVANFVSDQLVGLWDSSGNLLASATNTASSAQLGLWAFDAIAPVRLVAGNEYVVGSQGNTKAHSGDTPIAVNSQITYLRDLWAEDPGEALCMPTLTELTGENSGWFGANLLLDALVQPQGAGAPVNSPDSAPVPEPSTLLLLLGGGLAAAAKSRRQRGQQ